MSYKEQLQTNNESLQELITKANNLPEAGDDQATPVIIVNSSNGLITATAGTKTTTHQLAFQAAQTITPGTTNKTIAANTYLGGVQTIKGDANLVASNIKSGTSIFGVTGTYEGSGSGGGDAGVEDSIIDRTITSYTNYSATKVGAYAFTYCMQLTTANFFAAKSIYGSAFASCSNLTVANFPAVTSIGASVFYSCSKLTSISFPVANFIKTYAFGYCLQLQSAIFPLGRNIEAWAFLRCSSLTLASFASAKAIGASAFLGCYNLKSLYLTGSSVCSLANSNAFSSTPIGGYTTSAGTYGSIFVPASLLASYKTATNWSYFSSRFVGI